MAPAARSGFIVRFVVLLSDADGDAPPDRQSYVGFFASESPMMLVMVMICVGLSVFFLQTMSDKK